MKSFFACVVSGWMWWSAVNVCNAQVLPVPTMDYFQAQLAPYGNWVNVSGNGPCWQPSVDPGWRPYYDGGSWIYSDDGWYWQSDYPWGDIAFHYGRWFYTVTGWIWEPGFDYAPAWVVWRHADADGYVGWSPLPPGAIFVNGGWMFNGVRVGIDFDFGLRADFFTFVAYDHFWEHDFRHFIVPHDRLALIYRRSLIENHYRVDHGRFVNEGLSRDRMAALTHRDVRDIKPMAVQNLKQQEEQRNILARRDDINNIKLGTKPNAMRAVEPERNIGRSDPQSRHPAQNSGTTPGRNSNVSGLESKAQPEIRHPLSTSEPNNSRGNVGEGMIQPGHPALNSGTPPGRNSNVPEFENKAQQEKRPSPSISEPNNNRGNVGEGLKNTTANSPRNQKGQQPSGGSSQAGRKGGNTDSKEKKDNGS